MNAPIDNISSVRYRNKQKFKTQNKRGLPDIYGTIKLSSRYIEISSWNHSLKTKIITVRL